MEGLAGLIEAELSRLARAHRSPEAFEALFRVLWTGVARDGARERTRGMSNTETGKRWHSVITLKWAAGDGSTEATYVATNTFPAGSTQTQATEYLIKQAGQALGVTGSPVVTVFRFVPDEM
jgi:hypothetical protein